MALDIEYIVRFVDEFSAVANKVKASMAGIAEKSEQVSHKLHHMSRMLKRSARELAEVFAAEASSIFAIKAAAQTEELTQRLNSLTDSSKYVSIIMSGLGEISEKGAAKMGDLVDATQNLIENGVELKDIVPTMNDLVKISVASRQSIGDVSEFFAKIKSQGKLTEGDFQDLIKFNLLKPLEDKTHSSAKKIREAIKAGLIGFPMISRVIKDTTEGSGVFANAVDKNFNTIDGSFGALKAEVEESLSTIGDTINKSIDVVSLFHKAGEIVKGFAKSFESFQKAHPELTKTIIEISLLMAAIAPLLLALGLLAGVGSVVAAGFGLITKALSASFIVRGLFGVITSGFGMILKSILPVNFAMKILGVTSKLTWASLMGPIFEAIQLFFIFAAAGGWVRKKFEEHFGSLRKIVYNAVYAIIKFAFDLKDKLMSAFKPLINFFGAVETKLSNIASKVKGVFSSAKAPNTLSSTPMAMSQSLAGYMAGGAQKSISDVNIHIIDKGDNVKNVESKSKGNTNLNVGMNMAEAY